MGGDIQNAFVPIFHTTELSLTYFYFSVALYEEALQLSNDFLEDKRNTSILSRTQERVAAIERSAVASGVFATIQFAQVRCQLSPSARADCLHRVNLLQPSRLTYSH